MPAAAEKYFEIFHEKGDDSSIGNWTCHLKNSQEPFYCLEVKDDGTAIVHRGSTDNDSSLASGTINLSKQGVTDLRYLDSSTQLVMKHRPRQFLLVPEKTSFTFGEKKYYWKGTSNLFEAAHDTLKASFFPMVGEKGKVGELLVAVEDEQLREILVISALVMRVVWWRKHQSKP